jgi:hypothetical protein
MLCFASLRTKVGKGGLVWLVCLRRSFATAILSSLAARWKAIFPSSVFITYFFFLFLQMRERTLLICSSLEKLGYRLVSSSGEGSTRAAYRTTGDWLG